MNNANKEHLALMMQTDAKSKPRLQTESRFAHEYIKKKEKIRNCQFNVQGRNTAGLLFHRLQAMNEGILLPCMQQLRLSVFHRCKDI